MSVAFSPDGGTVAAAGADGGRLHRTVIPWPPPRMTALRMWDVRGVRDGRPAYLLAVVEGHADAVKALAFTADSRTLASGGADHSIRLWNVTVPGRPVPTAVLNSHGKPVDALAFAPDGHTLASGSEDWTGLLWETDPAQVAARICRETRASIPTQTPTQPRFPRRSAHRLRPRTLQETQHRRRGRRSTPSVCTSSAGRLRQQPAPSRSSLTGFWPGVFGPGLRRSAGRPVRTSTARLPGWSGGTATGRRTATRSTSPLCKQPPSR
ncbi:hypothetical protein EHS43_16325 [Streptomyces sp. RP5T]|nr:hypothetical protein EHS43_16325 [Streptomyces sp. RP5T]